MKTSLFTATFLMVVMFAQASASAEVRPVNFGQEQMMVSNICRTIEYKGERIPVCDLAVVEITDFRIAPKLVPAFISNNEVVASVDLPEVVIETTALNNNIKPAIMYKGEATATFFLPEVEIVSLMPVHQLTAMTRTDNGWMPTVNLEPVDIYALDPKPIASASTDSPKWDVSVGSNPQLAKVSENAGEQNQYSFSTAMESKARKTSARGLNYFTSKVIQFVEMIFSGKASN